MAQLIFMNLPIPTKLAFNVRPGEMLVVEEEPKLVTGVSWKPSRDEVVLRTEGGVKSYHMEDRVPYLPRDG
ncbi:MAG: hypothetical protein HKO76_00645 [Acidimicrobiia bacterium]|nr:hypothetical protein [Acidimicrobiia bacterium]